MLKYTWQRCLNCGYSIQNLQASSLPVGKQNHHQQQPQRKILYYRADTSSILPKATMAFSLRYGDVDLCVFTSSNFHSLLNVRTDYSHSRALTPHFSGDIWTYKNGSVWDTFGAAFEKVAQRKILGAVGGPMCKRSA